MINYPPETHLNLESRKILFAHYLFLILPKHFGILHKACQRQYRAKAQNNWATEINVMDEQ